MFETNINNDFKFSFINYKSPLMISVDVTNSCNFRCLHCYNNSGNKIKNELSDENLLNLIKQIGKLQCYNVCLCGGEPLMRKNIIDLVYNLSPNVAYVNMVSNGSLLTKEKITHLKTAGLHSLQLSLDGINAFQHDSFRGYIGSFDKVLECIEYATKLNLDIAVACSPNKLNHKTISTYIDFCYQLGVKSARFMPLIPMGRASNMGKLLLTSEDYLKLQITINEKKNEYQYKDFNVEWGDPLDHYSRLPNNDYSYTMDIKSNGDVALSPYINIVAGNVRNNSIQEIWDNGFNKIWHNEKIQNFIKNITNIYDINELNIDPLYNDSIIIDLPN